MDERAILLDGQRVVEVLRRLRVDCEREPLAEVDPALQIERRRLEGLEPTQLALFDQQPLEHDLDPARVAEHALDARPPAAFADDRQLPRLAGRPAVERERRAGHEVRLADEVLASRRELYDDRFRPGGNA